MRDQAAGEAPTLDSLEGLAAGLLPTPVFEYFQSGSRREQTSAANERAWQSWWLMPRMFADVSSVSTQTVVLGQRIDAPILAAPMGLVALAHEEGDVAVARSMSAAGLITVVSQTSLSSLADIAAVATERFWVQHYPLTDRRADTEIVRSVRDAGAGAVVVTVDFPLRTPTRARPRDGLAIPPDDRFPPESGRGRPVLTAITGRYLSWIRDTAGIPVVVKGIMHPQDAVTAAESGAAAVIVSNHGGRTLDGALPTADALPDVVDAVGGRVEVYVDGGIRRGGDIVRALALGARAVLVGRPLAWGLAWAGSAGVTHVVNAMRRELEQDLALCGAADVANVSRELVRRRDASGH